MKDNAGVWRAVAGQRLKERQGGRQFRWWRLVLYTGYGLMVLACWGILAIYGPVLGAELGFQLRRNAGPEGQVFWGLVPNISIDLVPPTLATGYAIVIPKIYVAEPVVVNVDPNDVRGYRAALNNGIALAAGTALPGDGGLGYYFAHSSGMNVLAPQKQATFYLLGKLNLGDEVDIYREKAKYRYRVINKQITSPEDVSFLQQTSDKELIVLQTCWPIGTSLQRLLVTAEMIN